MRVSGSSKNKSDQSIDRKAPRIAAALFCSVLCMLLCAAAAVAGCEKQQAEPVSRQGFYLDTVCEITVWDMEEMSEESASEAIRGAYSLCAEYEDLLSRTRPESDIGRLNAAGGAFTECDPRTLEVLRAGLYYSESSDGVFDITIGTVTSLWDFHDPESGLPGQAALEEALTHVDWRGLTVTDSGAQLADPLAAVELGGIAKGYIADRLADYLRGQGVTGAVINLGGNVECIGSKRPEKKGGERIPFRIGIETPYSDRKEILGVVEVTDGTVVTSGIYERYIVVDGREYHHILDPSTGWPAETDVLSVTLCAGAGRSADCDALATTCLLLGTEKGLARIEAEEGIEALFVGLDGEIRTTSGMVWTPIK